MIFPLQKQNLIELPNQSQEYLQAWAVTGRHLQKLFNQYNTMDNVPCNGFNWIRTDTAALAFDTMNFRYKNHVFSVLFELIDLGEDKFISRTPIEAKNLQIQICKENNLTPCLFKIKSRNMQPVTGSWNLFDTLTDKKINPLDLSDDTPVQISDWELLNWAVATVISDLKAKEYKIISFTDTPGKAPNIWFEDKEAKQNWVQVKINNKACDPAQNIIDKYTGYIADVTIIPANNQPAIYRSQPAAVGYGGLKSFE